MENYKLHKLENKYILWYHNPNINDWSLSSYKTIMEYVYIEDYLYHNNKFDKNIINTGMFFIMKKNINPTWEDKQNIEGGCISIKILRDESFELWKRITIHLLSNNLNENVNGISISPKKNFNIIKIWISEEIDIKKYKLPDSLNINNKNLLFRVHKTNIEKDKIKKN